MDFKLTFRIVEAEIIYINLAHKNTIWKPPKYMHHKLNRSLKYASRFKQV